MSFTERQLQFTFSGENTGTLSASGLRALTSIQAYGGRMGVSAQVKIYGLTEAQANAYSSRISAGVGVSEFSLTIEAGDVGSKLSRVISGNIWRSYIDLQDIPESSFNVTVAGVIYAASGPVASQSQPGEQAAESLIASICAKAGLTLQNNGAHAMLRNQVTYGSAIDQIAKIARAAKFQWYVVGSAIYLWPANGQRDQTVITVGPNTSPRMVGYPAWWEAGIIVRSLFNQEIQVGRRMQVISSIPRAEGVWQIVQVQHELSTMLSHGPWFTTAILAPVGFTG
jgi:hypothetical protein